MERLTTLIRNEVASYTSPRVDFDHAEMVKNVTIHVALTLSNAWDNEIDLTIEKMSVIVERWALEDGDIYSPLTSAYAMSKALHERYTETQCAKVYDIDNGSNLYDLHKQYENALIDCIEVIGDRVMNELQSWDNANYYTQPKQITELLESY